ncbi:MAG: acyl carrier protein [Candidatus Marinimicrobia bacterium]|nr:acyl carrier protein [Candidatus Neomarinimicrobiota bacterium]
MAKKRVIVVCPGRGSYTRETSNYLSGLKPDISSHIISFDKKRESENLTRISELDKNNFRSKIHMTGENASPLIYACSVKDFMLIDKTKYDIVAICGNSMGWYIALALGGAITFDKGYDLIQTMGTLTQNHGSGGQIIYPIINDEWQIDIEKKELVLKEIENSNSFISIYLGGYIVIGGDQNSLDRLLKKLPRNDKYPFQIPFHSAFHTSLLSGVVATAQSSFNRNIFNRPSIPLVDGRGNIWSPWSTNKSELYNYTLGHQIIKPYNFSASIEVALKEFCPDNIILLGPGNTLGGPVAQVLIDHNWNDLKAKSEFVQNQAENPFVLSMGIDEQRGIVM